MLDEERLLEYAKELNIEKRIMHLINIYEGYTSN